MAFDENKFEWFFKRVENNNNRKLLEFIEKTVKNKKEKFERKERLLEYGGDDAFIRLDVLLFF